MPFRMEAMPFSSMVEAMPFNMVEAMSISYGGNDVISGNDASHASLYH